MSLVPRGADNDVAIDLIVQHIQEILRSPQSSYVAAVSDDNDSLKKVAVNGSAGDVIRQVSRPH